MTEDEARKVKVGDVLRAKIGGRYSVVEVVAIGERLGWLGDGMKWYGKNTPLFTVRRTGARTHDKLGNELKNTNELAPHQVGWAAEHECKKDPVTANVFSDWLDENGFHDAARALRAAFPVGLPKEGK